MITEALLSLIATIEQNGGLDNIQLKLICDKQTYNVITSACLGLINPITESKSIGLNFIIEIGDLN